MRLIEVFDKMDHCSYSLIHVKFVFLARTEKIRNAITSVLSELDKTTFLVGFVPVEDCFLQNLVPLLKKNLCLHRKHTQYKFLYFGILARCFRAVLIPFPQVQAHWQIIKLYQSGFRAFFGNFFVIDLIPRNKKLVTSYFWWNLI